MPTYQYECDACSTPLEVVQSFSDDALTKCPNCGEEKLRKVYGSVGVVFKGSGFYRTDSRGSGASTTESTPSSSTQGTQSTSNTSTSSPSPSTSTSTPSSASTTSKTTKPTKTTS